MIYDFTIIGGVLWNFVHKPKTDQLISRKDPTNICSAAWNFKLNIIDLICFICCLFAYNLIN